MNIKIRNEYRAEAEISADEMEEMEVSFDALDYASPDTRMLLWNVIEEMRGEGIDIDFSGKVLIEAFDNGTGGCVIAFTVLPCGNTKNACVKQLVKNTSSAVMISSPDAQTLINFAFGAGEMRSELYYYGGEYRLFVFPEKSEREKLGRLLPEYYGDCSPNVALKLAVCREKGTLLQGSKALSKLSALRKNVSARS